MDRLDRARETAGGTTHPVPGGMIETAENLRRAYGISREEQDQLAVRSHHRAVAAHQAGKFADEWSQSPFPASAASPTPSSTATSTPGPTPPSRAHRAPPDPRQDSIPSPPSPPATPRGRTTAPRCASSPPAPRPTSAV